MTEISILLSQLGLVDVCSFTGSYLLAFLGLLPISRKQVVLRGVSIFFFFKKIRFGSLTRRASKEFLFFRGDLETLQNSTFYSPLLILNFAFFHREI